MTEKEQNSKAIKSCEAQINELKQLIAFRLCKRVSANLAIRDDDFLQNLERIKVKVEFLKEIKTLLEEESEKPKRAITHRKTKEEEK